jgi:hypothetical protein
VQSCSTVTAKKIDIRIKRKATYVKAPPPKAKKKRVVKAKKAPKKERKETLRFDAFNSSRTRIIEWDESR